VKEFIEEKGDRLIFMGTLKGLIDMIAWKRQMRKIGV